MVHKLILMKLRINGVSFQACFNITLMLKEKLLLRSRVLLAGQSTERLLPELNRRQTTKFCEMK